MGLDALEDFISEIELPPDAAHPLLQALNTVLDCLLHHAIFSETLLTLQGTCPEDSALVLAIDLRMRVMVRSD